MAYSDSFPATRPVFMADFANGGKIDPRASYSRSTTGSFYGKDKHLSSDNLLTYSTSFDQWSASGHGARTGGQADPAGGTSAFEIPENSSSGFHRVYQELTASGDLAFTVYAKQNSGTRYLTLTLFSADNNWVAATFDLAGGAAATGSGSSSSFTSLTATQTASGNGFYKCVIKATGSITKAFASLSNATTAPIGTYGLPSYTGDGTSSIDLAFASLTTTGATDYNATTTQIHREYAPTLQTAAINAARFEYSATDGESMGTSLGCLIEGQSTNLISYSDDITNAWWGKSFIDAYSGAAVGPTGTLNSGLIVASATYNPNHYLQRTGIATTVSTTYTYSLYVKSAGVTNFAILTFQNTSPFTQFGYANVNLATGTISGSIGSATIDSVGNGWYRVSVSGAALTTVSNTRLWIQDSAGNALHTPNGYDGLLVAGQQFEASSHCSSLISTSGSTVTRAADSLSLATADIGYTGGPVSIVGEVRFNEATASSVQYLMHLSNGTADNAIGVSRRNSGGYANKLQAFVESDNVDQGSIYVSTSTVTDDTDYTWAISVDTNDFKADLNGLSNGTSDTGVTLPTSASTLKIGGYLTSGSELEGHVKRIAVYPALTSTNLQALTS
jgi:hypothetical protein